MVRPAVALLLLTLCAASAAAMEVGSVARVQGVSTGTIGGETRALVTGAPIHLDEVLATGEGARLGVALRDGTVLTLGENARLTVDEFVFDSAGENTLHASIAGAFRYVSGALAQPGSHTASVTTPVALIGIRGTDFWGGPIDGGFGVALFEGSISVTSDGVTRILEAPGFGVDVAPGSAPGAATVWADAKVARALATVTFP